MFDKIHQISERYSANKQFRQAYADKDLSAFKQALQDGTRPLNRKNRKIVEGVIKSVALYKKRDMQKGVMSEVKYIEAVISAMTEKDFKKGVVKIHGYESSYRIPMIDSLIHSFKNSELTASLVECVIDNKNYVFNDRDLEQLTSSSMENSKAGIIYKEAYDDILAANTYKDNPSDALLEELGI